MNKNKLYGYHKAQGLMYMSAYKEQMYIYRFGRYPKLEQLMEVLCSLHQKHIIVLLQYTRV